MLCRVLGLALISMLSATSAPAQAPSASRLAEVIKSGTLRVCTPGDYKPFSFLRPDGSYEGLDIDLVEAAAKALGVKVEMVKTAWPSLMKDFQEKCDVAVGGISVTTDRQKSAFFTMAYMVKPTVTVIENPGGSNERFARANFKQAKIVIFPDNVTIFDEILKGNADVMISESVETIVQAKARPGLCAVNPD